MDIEKIFYEWAATYGASKEEADRSLNGKELMIEFAEMVVKESDSLPPVSDYPSCGGDKS